MSWEAVQWANKQRLRLPQEQLLLLLIANAADPDGVAFRWWRKREHWWTYLVAHSRQSRASVFRHLNTLEQSGLAEREAVATDDGDKRFHVNLKLDVFVNVDADDGGGGDGGGNAESHGETQSQSHGETQPVAPVRPPESQSCDSKESPNQNPILERETHAREDKRPSVKRFLLKWPTAAIDDKAHITRAWDALPEDELEPCIEGVEGFLAELKKHGRKHIPAGWKYIEDQSWKLIGKPAESVSTHVMFDCWSKDWWASLLGKIERRESIKFMLHYASEPGRRKWSASGVEVPTPEELSEFKNYPSDGPEMAAWRPWFEARGAALPNWEKRIWVFLPSPSPPGSFSTGPPHLSDEDAKAFTDSMMK